MYFSKNTGYVLWKAKCLSPVPFFSCLKGTHRTLAVKSPSDDPSKPPLRLNVPNDSSQRYEGQSQDSSKFVEKNFQEPRSRSLLSRPDTHSFNADEDANVMQKSESETQLSKFHDDMIQNVHNLNSTASSEDNERNVDFNQRMQVNFQPNSQVSDKFDFQKPDYDPNEGLVTLLDENYYYDSNVNKNLETVKYAANINNNEINKETKTNKSDKKKQENKSHNSLYIIIDVPEKQEEEKFDNVNAAFKNRNEVGKGKFTSKQSSEDNFYTVKTTPPNTVNSTSKTSKNNIKSNWAKSEQSFDFSKEKNKNFSKNLSKEGENKSNSNVRFEVHELDDASTYVFHLKLKRSLTGKPSTVERVPEKEINTRTQAYDDESFDLVRMKSGKGVTREVADINVGDFTDKVKPSDIMMRNQAQGKRDLHDTSSKSKQVKYKVKSRRCLTDCPYPKVSSKKDNEKPDVKKNYKNQDESHKYSSSNSDPMKTEDSLRHDHIDRTKIEVQNLDDLEMAFDETNHEISPLKNPESLAYQFLKDWELNFGCPSEKSSQQQPIKKILFQTTDLPYSSETEQISEDDLNLSDNYSAKFKNFRSLEQDSDNTEDNYKTFQQEVMPENFVKASPQVEENKSRASSNYQLEKRQGNKEYFNYPLPKRQPQDYGNKTVVLASEKRQRENCELRLSDSSSQGRSQNSSFSKEAINAAGEKAAKRARYHGPSSTASSRAERPIGVLDKDPMKMEYMQFVNQTKAKKNLKKRESENRFVGNDPKESNFQFSGLQSGGRKSGEEEKQEINSITHHKKTGSSSRYVPNDRNNWGGRDGRGGSGSHGKFTKVKLSKAEENLSGNIKREPDIVNFQPSESVIKISSDKPYMKFCAAFPPTLSEVMSNRCKGLGLIKQETLFQQTWGKRINLRLKEFENNRQSMTKVDDLSENSILFPKTESQSFFFNYSLFENKKDGILNVLKNEKSSDGKIADNMANIANENLTENMGESSVDSLTMMKKVKEIVDMDLQNAVTIFEGREADPPKDVSSVLIWTGDTWKVDLCELQKHVENRQGKSAGDIKLSAYRDENLRINSNNIKASNIILGNDKNSKKIDEKQTSQPKYLPGVRETEAEIKLNSVVELYPNSNTFKINEDELKSELCRSSEKFNKLYEKAAVLSVKQLMQDGNYKDDFDDVRNQIEEIPAFLEMKNGDSILVFDELTQTWTVDYSILEKRQQQKKQEEELARKSELILETFEKIEKENVSTLERPTPDSSSPKIFDYNTAEWKVYQPEKKNSLDKSKKSKQPFRESNAEEIRKKNSDLYENLFAVKKEERKTNENRKEAPGPKSSGNTKKESHHKTAVLAKDTKENESKDSGDCKKNCDEILQDKSKKEKKSEDCDNEDENYWETFLKTNILPFDRTESVLKENPAVEKIPEKKEETDKKIEDINKSKESKEKPPPSSSSSSSCPKSGPTSGKKGNELKFRFPNPFKKNDSCKPSSEKENKQLSQGEGLSKSLSVFGTKPKNVLKDEKDSKPGSLQSEKSKNLSKDDCPNGTKKDSKPESLQSEKSKNLSKDDCPNATKKDSKPEPLQSAPSTTETPSKSTRSLHSQDVDPLITEAPPLYEKNTKNWSEHYVSDNILEMSKSILKENNSKLKSNKVETVKVNISSDKKKPSVVTEINLNKKCEEQLTESSAPPIPRKKLGPGELKEPSDNTQKKIDKPSIENKKFYKNFEKFKTPFGDPEYEEKSVKINSDLESNPNLKKLDTWNKTLVLHDVGKPNDNIETWLKDESDKMATLLLKVLQEAAEGKPKKKNPQTKTVPNDKNTSGSNPYDNIRKKQETNSDNFLFKMGSVNMVSENQKKLKNTEGGKSTPLKFLPNTKNIPVQSAKTSKPPKIVEVIKISPGKGSRSANLPIQETVVEDLKLKTTGLNQEKISCFSTKELCQRKFLAEWTDEIPGPEILKKMSNAWKLFPIIGCQLTVFTLLRIFQLVNLGNSFLTSMGREKSRRHVFFKLFAKYGPIVNLQGPLSGNVILIHKPEHLSGVFQQDALLSVRSVFDSIDQCRRDADSKFFQTGISTDWSKPEWEALRKRTNDPLLKGCEKFFPVVEAAGDNLVNKIKLNKNAQNYVSEDFMEEIKKWSMEGYFGVVLERTLRFLESTDGQVTWLLEPEKLYCAVEEATMYLNKCERGFQVWRIMPTPSSVGLSQAYCSLSGILTKQLYHSELNLKSKNEILKSNNLSYTKNLTFMESMLLNDGITLEEIICNLIDIMIIGTNAMSSALGFMLYNLAQNVKVQKKLFNEVKEHLPNKNSRLDYHKLHSLKYLQACLKESLRLNMPFPLFFRFLQNDVILSNYIVPKGTYVVMDSKIFSMREQVFDEPEKFLPERWLNDERWMQANHPFSAFPFCHGPRAELAKRIAEIQLWSCLAQIVRNFEIEYHFGEIQGTESLISFPNKPLKLNFIERAE